MSNMMHPPELESMERLLERLRNGSGQIDAESLLSWMITPRPLDEYDEDMGPVSWWKFPVEEAAWIGKPEDSDWPGYHTHFTPHPPIPREPTE